MTNKQGEIEWASIKKVSCRIKRDWEGVGEGKVN